jgi:hypothetical protein
VSEPAAEPSISSLTPPPTGLPLSPQGVTPPSLIRQQNPLFESDDGAPQTSSETRIPQEPHGSQRSNRGVIDRYDPGAYAAFTKGLPTMKNVRFDPDPTVWVFRPQGCPLNLKP